MRQRPSAARLPSRTRPSDCAPARCWRCSARTARARAPASSCWPASIRPIAGSVVVDGAPVAFALAARRAGRGIAVMHQHPGLFPDLSVAENIFIGHMPRGRSGGLDHRAMRAARERCCSIGRPRRAAPKPGSERCAHPSSSWSRSPARCRSKARVLIMDEPTAALSQREVERLFAVVASCAGRAWR